MAIPGAIAAPEYFPLRVGNSWVYKVTQGRTATEPQVVEVQALETIDGNSYYRVSFFGRIVWLRPTDDGSLMAYDTENKQEKMWLGLGANEGESFTTNLDACTNSGRIETRSAKMSVPLGEFSDVLRVTFRGLCADAGVTEQDYLPYVGLLRHVTTSIAGPVQYDLLYVRSGFTNADAGQIGFGVTVDANTYAATDTARATVRLSLRSTLSDPITLTFPSGQNFDVKVTNEKGETVYVWSADKLFTAIFRTERFGPGEKNYAISVPLGRLPTGRYVVEGYLSTQPRFFTGTSTFEIVR